MYASETLTSSVQPHKAAGGFRKVGGHQGAARLAAFRAGAPALASALRAGALLLRTLSRPVVRCAADAATVALCSAFLRLAFVVALALAKAPGLDKGAQLLRRRGEDGRCLGDERLGLGGLVVLLVVAKVLGGRVVGGLGRRSAAAFARE